MMLSTEISLIPNMERRLATMRPFPDPGPPERNTLVEPLSKNTSVIKGQQHTDLHLL